MCKDLIDFEDLTGSVFFVKCQYSFIGKTKDNNTKRYIDITNTRKHYTQVDDYDVIDREIAGVAKYSQLVIQCSKLPEDYVKTLFFLYENYFYNRMVRFYQKVNFLQNVALVADKT